MTYGVLFVCTGNICRSPCADGIFRHMVDEAGLSQHFIIDSAGTHGYHVGDPPDPRAIDVALDRGVKLGGLRARQFSGQDFRDFDLLLAMDSHHYAFMDRARPARGKGRLSMFLNFVPDAGCEDVPDPYYGGVRDFEHVFDLCEQGCEGLLMHLRKELAL